jgi:hypothetical protein
VTEARARPETPIASELHDHLARGGTPADGVRLVELLELSGRKSKKRAKHSDGRGSRLPPDWRPCEADIAYAIGRGIAMPRIEIEAEKFRNFWLAKSGVDACKRDWHATWRNWIINATEKAYGPTNRGQGPRIDSSSRRSPTGSDAVLAGMGRLARRVDARQRAEVADRRSIPVGPDASQELDLEPGRAR